MLNFNQQELHVLLGVTNSLSLRGGHRYTWGDARNPGALVLAGRGITEESGKLRRNAGLAGATFGWTQRFRVTADFEASAGDQEYFRTSLHDYQKARIQARYQPMGSIQLAAHFSVLNNQNPSLGSDRSLESDLAHLRYTGNEKTATPDRL